VDESSVRSDSHRGFTWGDTPVVKDSGGRFGLKLISSITPHGEMHSNFIKENMNSAKFI
jgi:hypothetical protein